MSHTSDVRVFSSVKRLLALLETIAGVPHRQVAKQPNRLYSFRFFFLLSARTAEAIIMILTEQVAFSLGYCTHSIACSFSSNSRALSSGHLPFIRHFMTRLHMRRVQPTLDCAVCSGLLASPGS